MLVCFDPINIATTEPWVNPAITSSEEIEMCASGPCDANMFLIRHKNILIVSIFKIFAAPRRAETRNSHPGGGRSAAAGGGIDEGFYLGCRAGGWAGLGWAGLGWAAAPGC